MKKLTALLITGVLSLGVVACADSTQTSVDAPDTTEENPEALEPDEARDAQSDATSEIRRQQLDADIRAREERNDAVNQGAAVDRVDYDLASEVRSKLEANLPASALQVDAEDGVITVTGTVPTQEQWDRIQPLAQEIKGVQSVNILAKVAPAQPEANN